MFYLQIYSIPKTTAKDNYILSLVPNAYKHMELPTEHWITIYEHPHFEQCRRNEIIVNAHRHEHTRIISTGIEPA